MAAQRGQIMVMFVLVLALLMLAVLALVGDFAAVDVRWSDVDNAALIGAQAGSSAVAQSSILGGGIALDPALATTRCQSAAEAYRGVTATCTVNGSEITAVTKETVALPISIWTSSVTIQSTRKARAASGISQGGF